jgi:uncharacterized damage-inducible protein DinB
MSIPFPSPTIPVATRAEVFLGYLDYSRSSVISKVESLPPGELRTSCLQTGWTPLELLKHLRWVELRWLEWGFEGRQLEDPWGDNRDERWHVGDGETRESLVAELTAQGARSRAIVGANDLSAVGQPGPRWGGAEPATLERILLHLIQEYARHLGHIDIVAELRGGATGE